MSQRSRRADGERTRERILEVALPLFAARGYAGTSIRRIARAAGVNVAMIGYHFGDKQGLYDAVVVRLHEDLERDFTDDLLSSADPGAGVEDLVRRAWDFARAHRDAIRLQIRHVLDAGGQPAVVVRERSEPLLRRAEALVGMFRPSWSRTERRMLVLSLMHAVVRLSLEDPDQLAAMLGGVDDVDGAVVAFLGAMVRRELGLPTPGG